MSTRSRGWTLLLLVTAALTGAGTVAPTAAQTAASNPHGRLRRSVDCDVCHTMTAWKPARENPAFSHRRDTGFPLDGAHARATCDRCHLGLRFAEPRAAAGDCAVCHVDVHRGGLGGECADCHDTGAWTGSATIRAHARVNFPLTGAHLRVACVACHRDDRTGAFTRVDPSCDGCHAMDYEGTTFPDHRALSYSTECRACHGTASWHGAAFDHTGMGFLLVGVHASLACVTCHLPPDNAPIALPTGSDDCVACHQPDYDAAHTATGYPTTCTMCHVPTTWGAAAFDHDGPFFPIYSGRHRGEWSTCLDCHPTAQNFALFTCLTCHGRADTDDRHVGEPGYVYESTACLSCHPDGEAD